MKKVDWLIAAFFVMIGLVCLTVSAMYYQGDTFISRMDYFKPNDMHRDSCFRFSHLSHIPNNSIEKA